MIFFRYRQEVGCGAGGLGCAGFDGEQEVMVGDGDGSHVAFAAGGCAEGFTGDGYFDEVGGVSFGDGGGGESRGGEFLHGVCAAIDGEDVKPDDVVFGDDRWCRGGSCCGRGRCLVCRVFGCDAAGGQEYDGEEEEGEEVFPEG